MGIVSAKAHKESQIWSVAVAQVPSAGYRETIKTKLLSDYSRYVSVVMNVKHKHSWRTYNDSVLKYK